MKRAPSAVRRFGWASLLAVALGTGAKPAAAFCRTTTCNASGSTTGCDIDANGCATAGVPLSWPSRCLSFGVQQDGSVKRHISYETFDGIIRTAFAQWVDADCGEGAHPSFEIWDFDQTYGPIICATPEFNQESPNANVWMFRDSDWPYKTANSTLALTTLTFELTSGIILDADVEVNSFAIDLTTGNTHVVDDLQSIATHEAGHFLGIAHSNDPTATMFATYDQGEITLRSLAPDDEKAICAAYPPTRAAATCTAPDPAHGFSRYCATDDPPGGCSVTQAGTRPSSDAQWVGLWVAATLLSIERRRRAR